jgi:hypothetical protein
MLREVAAEIPAGGVYCKTPLGGGSFNEKTELTMKKWGCSYQQNWRKKNSI